MPSFFYSVGVVSLPETVLFSGNKGTVQVCATLSADENDTTVHAISISLTARENTGEPLVFTTYCFKGVGSFRSC